jgi:DNA repair protein RecO (recombination protein O)
MSTFRDRAVVLRTYRLGEADRIVVMLTERHGKVRAVAKGVRRTKSKFGARLDPLTHVELLGWQGRGDLDIVNQVEVIDLFRTVRGELRRMTCGLSLLEVAEQVSQERHPEPRLYEMLVGALRALDLEDRAPELLAPAFFLKVLVLEGAGPVLDVCVSCGAGDSGEPVDLVAFDPVEGGTLCRRCRRGRSVSPEALALMRAITGGGLGAVLQGEPPPGAAEVATLATEAMEVHLDRRLRTVRSVAGL